MNIIEMTKVKKTWFHKGWVIFSIFLSIFYLAIGSMMNFIFFTPLMLILQIPIYIGVIVLHEFIHIAWKAIFKYTGKIVTVKNGKSTIITFVVNEPIKYWHFLVIVASPFLVINIAYLLCLPYSFQMYFFLAILFNNIGCSIDTYLILKVRKIKPATITVNNGIVTLNKLEG